MAKLAFLSDEWIAEARKIRAEYQDKAPAITVPVRMNLNVKGGPDGVRRAHLDTTSGRVDLDVDHLDQADLTLTVDADTAKAILLGGDPQVAMQAFMSGRIKIDGDITKLLALQSAGPSIIGGSDAAVGGQVVARINAITA